MRAILSILCLSCLGALAQTQEASTLQSAGARKTGGNFVLYSTTGQEGAQTVMKSATHYLLGGFFNRLTLRPDDLDGDGVADEIDPDNDGDTLDDDAELDGGAFDPVTVTDPNRKDSDDDGAADGQEAVAGTDPTDPQQTLRVTEITLGRDGAALSWQARGGKSYEVYRKDRWDGPENGTLLRRVDVMGGAAPWFVVNGQFTDAQAGDTHHVYYIRVLP